MNQQRQQVEVNVGVDVGAKGQKGSEAQKTQHLARALGGKALKESFSLNFESLFLDMFTEVPVKASTKAPEPTRSMIDVAPLPARAEAPQAAPKAYADAPAPQAAVEPAPVRNDQPAPARNQEVKPVERQEVATSGEEAPAETTAALVEAPKGEMVVTHVKMVKIELHAHLQKALSAEEVQEVGDKLKKLVSDEDLEPAELYAGVLEIVAGLLNPSQPVDAPQIAEAAEVVPEQEGEELPAFQKFLRRFMVEVQEALPEGQVEQVSGAAIETPASIQQQVDEALSKLVAKMDRRLTPEDRRDVAELIQKLQADAVAAPEEKKAVAVEAPRTIEFKREAVRVQALDVKTDDGQKTSIRMEAVAESVVVDISRLKNRANQNTPLPTAGSGAVAGIEGAAKAGRPDGQSQTSWQNSYSQNSALRNAERTQAPARSEAPRPVQHPPVFDQIVQSARILVTEGKSEAVIKLNPEQLGKVEMKVTVEDGKVSVKFTAENQAVRAAITENLQELRKSLAELGLDVENVLVALAGQFQNGEQQEEERQAEANAGRRRGGVGGVDDADDEADEFAGAVTHAVAVADGSTVRYVA